MCLPAGILALAAFALFGCDASGIPQEEELFPCQQSVKVDNFEQQQVRDLELRIQDLEIFRATDPE